MNITHPGFLLSSPNTTPKSVDNLPTIALMKWLLFPPNTSTNSLRFLAFQVVVKCPHHFLSFRNVVNPVIAPIINLSEHYIFFNNLIVSLCNFRLSKNPTSHGPSFFQYGFAFFRSTANI